MGESQEVQTGVRLRTGRPRLEEAQLLVAMAFDLADLTQRPANGAECMVAAVPERWLQRVMRKPTGGVRAEFSDEDGEYLVEFVGFGPDGGMLSAKTIAAMDTVLKKAEGTWPAGTHIGGDCE